MRRLALSLVVLVLLSSSGCAAVSAASLVAKSRASEDLGCPSEHVHAYFAKGGTYVARGCGGWVQYDCVTPDDGDVVCIPHTHADVHADVHQDASPS
jgi:hypothetical protein